MKRRWGSRLLIAGTVGVMLGLLIYGFWPKPMAVDVAPVTRGPLQEGIEDEGRTRVQERYVVTAPASGVVARIELDPGTAVTPETVLTRVLPLSPSPLDPRTRAQLQAAASAAEDAVRQARTGVDRAQRAAGLARRELERMELLAAAHSVSVQQLDQARDAARAAEQEVSAARAGAEVARHQLEAARAALGMGAGSPGSPEVVPVISPIAGQVLRVLLDSERPVTAGTPLLELGNLRDLEVVVEVLTEDASRLRPGMRVALDRGGEQRALSGKVRRVEPAAFTKVSPLGTEEQRVNVVVELTEPAERFAGLGDGFRLQARFITWEGERVLQVPSSALFREGEGWAAYVLEGGKARRRGVKPGHRGALSTEVVEGLPEGATVIVHPGEAIREGVAVRAR